MKKYLLSLIVIALGIFIVSSAIAGPVAPGSGIKNTAHDLSFASTNRAFIEELGTLDIGGEFVDRFWKGTDQPQDERTATGMDRICIYCHAPHHTMTADEAEAAGITYYPLWNHAVTAQDTFLVYDNGQEDPDDLSHQQNSVDTIGDPSSVSKLCLSCHDGSVALNAYGFAPSESIGSGGTKIGDNPDRKRALIGFEGDLTNHHPIGFDYLDVAGQDDEIAMPTVRMASARLGQDSGYTINDLLWNGKMECTTCHDVHNTKNKGEKFTWISDKNSEFCLVCHIKDGATGKR